MPPIEQAWLKFQRATALHLAHPSIRETARSAFYAGATSLYADISSALQADGDAGVVLMKDVHREVASWLRDKHR